MNKKKLNLNQLIIGAILIFLLFVFLILMLNRKPEEVIIQEPIEEIHTDIDFSKLKLFKDRYYYEDNHYTSSFGIDVSTFQEHIDWKKVKDDGVEFVFIRIGRRGATTGLLYEDDMFEKNYEGARNNNIKVGIYFFSQALNTKEAIQEADWVINHLKGKEIDFPIVYDCEEVYLEEESSRIETLTKQQLTANALAFFKRLEEHGHQGILYTNQNWADEFIHMDSLQKYPIWFAQYDVDKPSLDYPIFMWQYSDKGIIDGIDYPVDLNIMFIKKVQ